MSGPGAGAVTDKIFSRFLGAWALDRDTCNYEQGSPPRSGRETISLEGEDIVLDMQWIDAEGNQLSAQFRGRSDGAPVAFAGGPLADSLCLAAPTQDALTISAFRDGILIMLAERTLSRDGLTMHVHQKVYLPDGTAPSNHADYRRVQ